MKFRLIIKETDVGERYRIGWESELGIAWIDENMENVTRNQTKAKIFTWREVINSGVWVELEPEFAWEIT